MYEDREPYTRNVFDSETNGQRVHNGQMRLKSIWKPIDQLKITFSARYADLVDPQRAMWRDVLSNSLAHLVFGTTLYPPNVTSLNSPATNTSQQNSQSLRVDYTFDGGITLTSISARQRGFTSTLNDVDASAADIIDSGAHDALNYNLTQEFQLFSPTNARVTWILGALYFYEERAQDVYIQIPIASYSTESYSAFYDHSMEPYGELTYKFTDHWSVTGGVRYVDETRSQHSNSTLIDPPVGPLPPTASSSKYTRANPKFTLSYKVPGMLLYATYAEGFKSGSADNPNGSTPVRPEIVKNFEIGSKLDFLDQRLRVNLAAFDMRYLDKVVSELLFGAANPAGIEVAQNAASAKIKGIETDVSWQIAKGLQAVLNTSFLDAKYDDFKNAAGYVSNAPFPGLSAVQVDASGETIEYSPKFSGSIGLNYDKDLAHGSLQFNIHEYYSSEYKFDFQGNTVQPGYGQLGASASYISPDGHWKVTGWGKNLTDRDYLAGATETTFGRAVVDAPPRTYGLNVTWRTP
jgi:iron complex outermembrane receptor protein